MIHVAGVAGVDDSVTVPDNTWLLDGKPEALRSCCTSCLISIQTLSQLQHG